MQGTGELPIEGEIKLLAVRRRQRRLTREDIARALLLVSIDIMASAEKNQSGWKSVQERVTDILAMWGFPEEEVRRKLKAMIATHRAAVRCQVVHTVE